MRARHHRRARALPPLDTVVLLMPRARDAAWHLHVAHSQVDVTPHIGVTIVAERATARSAVPAITPVASVRMHHSTSTVRIEAARTLVEHAHTRAVRVEPGRAPVAALSSTPAQITGRPQLTTSTPVPSLQDDPPLVVVRPTPSSPDPPPTVLAAPEPVRSARRDSDTPSAPAPAPSIDVERITDSVLSALDRRVIAHRERYGSI
jgi:hypothetical protein